MVMCMQVSLPGFRKEPQEPALGACGSRQRQQKKKDLRVKGCPSPTRAPCDWVRLETSDAAGEGSTRAKVQGDFSPAQRS